MDCIVAMVFYLIISQLRPNHFVIKIISPHKEHQKVVMKLYLGRLDISRDWVTPEYVKAIKYAATKQADDYVIATGKSYTLENFVQKVFDKLGLN